MSFLVSWWIWHGRWCCSNSYDRSCRESILCSSIIREIYGRNHHSRGDYPHVPTFPSQVSSAIDNFLCCTSFLLDHWFWECVILFCLQSWQSHQRYFWRRSSYPHAQSIRYLKLSDRTMLGTKPRQKSHISITPLRLR